MSKDKNQEAGLYPVEIEAEQSVLGAMLIEAQAIESAREVLNACDFDRAGHGELFEILCALADRGTPADAVTVLHEIETRKSQIETSYLMALLDAVPTAANVKYYAAIVADAAMRKRFILACHQGAALAMQTDIDAPGVLEKGLELLASSNGEEGRQIAQLIRAALLDIWDHAEICGESGGLSGLITPFSEFDRMTGGLQPSDLVIVAGRPSMGKTAFALAIAQKAAEDDKSVVIFSLEMSPNQLATRMLCGAAEIPSQSFRNGVLSQEQWTRAHEASSHLSNLPIRIDRRTNPTAVAIRRECRRLKRSVGLDLIVIDYLQLVSVDSGRRSESRTQEVTDITRKIKDLARELQVPVVLLSQLSRAVEKRDNKRPVMSDLYESGGIEAEADMVCFLYREQYYKDKSSGTHTSAAVPEEVEVIIRKHRNGPTGTFKVKFVPEYARFEEISDNGPTDF